MATRPKNILKALLILSTAALAIAATGCSKNVPANAAANPAAGPVSVAAAKPDQLALERAELEKVPSPLKSHYLAVATASAWQNPFVVVGTDSLKVLVLMGDPNPSALGAGGMLRPVGARRDIEVIAPDKLGE